MPPRCDATLDQVHKAFKIDAWRASAPPLVTSPETASSSAEEWEAKWCWRSLPSPIYPPAAAEK